MYVQNSKGHTVTFAATIRRSTDGTILKLSEHSKIYFVFYLSGYNNRNIRRVKQIKIIFIFRENQRGYLESIIRLLIVHIIITRGKY